MKADPSRIGIRITCLIGLMILLACPPVIRAQTHIEAEESEKAVSFVPDWLELAGTLELEATRQQNFDLIPPTSDVRTLLRPELQLETRLQVSSWDHFELVLILEWAREFEIQEEAGDEPAEPFTFGFAEAYVTVEELFGQPLAVQIGRQAFEDDRLWLFDEELDAIRLTYQAQRFRVEAFVARVGLIEKDFIHGFGKEDTDYYQLAGAYTFGSYLTIGAYVLAQDDNQSMGERPLFFGVQAQGRIAETVHYWLDAAHVRGKSEGLNIRGWGIDVGGWYQLDVPLKPAFIFSFAFGSGDRTPDSATDTTFRQTGLQGNSAEFGGITDILYYGELLDPELSNLLIFTAGLGLQPASDVSLMMMVHQYRQHHRASELRDAAIEAELTGESRDIGYELDGMGAWQIGPVELKLIVGAFFPGRAFPAEADTAFFTQFRVQVEF